MVDEAAVRWFWCLNVRHPKILCSLRVSKVVLFSHAALVLVGRTGGSAVTSRWRHWIIRSVRGEDTSSRSSASESGCSVSGFSGTELQVSDPVVMTEASELDDCSDAAKNCGRKRRLGLSQQVIWENKDR